MLIACGITGAPPLLSCSVVAVTLVGSIAPLKLTRTCAFTGTGLTWSAGLTATTVGAVVCVPVPVVKHTVSAGAATPLVPRKAV